MRGATRVEVRGAVEANKAASLGKRWTSLGSERPEAGSCSWAGGAAALTVGWEERVAAPDEDEGHKAGPEREQRTEIREARTVGLANEGATGELGDICPCVAGSEERRWRDILKGGLLCCRAAQ